MEEVAGNLNAMTNFRGKGATLGQKKKLQSPFTIQGGGENKSPEVSALNDKSTQHPNLEVSAILNVSIKVSKYSLSVCMEINYNRPKDS